jgi:dienelactone hydrolase
METFKKSKRDILITKSKLKGILKLSFKGVNMMMKTTLQYLFRFFLLAFILVSVSCTPLTITENDHNNVIFKRTSRDIFPADQTKLKGRLTKPTGDGPFPAVVMLLDKELRNESDHQWEEKLRDWGYVTLLVDTLGSRGIALYDYKPAHGDMHILWELCISRANDAFDAKKYLAGLPFVDPQKIAVIGWGFGGRAFYYGILDNKKDAFQAAISMYGGWPGTGFNAPLMILLGEGSMSSKMIEDAFRKQMAPGKNSYEVLFGKNSYEVLLKVYPVGYQGFDFAGSRYIKIYFGHEEHQHELWTLKYDQAAAEDSTIQVKKFLDKYLK